MSYKCSIFFLYCSRRRVISFCVVLLTMWTTHDQYKWDINSRLRGLYSLALCKLALTRVLSVHGCTKSIVNNIYSCCSKRHLLPQWSNFCVDLYIRNFMSIFVTISKYYKEISVSDIAPLVPKCDFIMKFVTTFNAKIISILQCSRTITAVRPTGRSVDHSVIAYY